MLTAPVMIPLMFAAAAADSGSSRQAYATCVHALMKPGLTEKITPDAFVDRVKTSCAAQEKAFRSAIVSEDKADGLPDAAAKKDAEDQVADFQQNSRDRFEEYQSTNTEPS